MHAINPFTRDGYIALIDNNNIRIVAGGFHFPNEIALRECAREYYPLLQSSSEKLANAMVEIIKRTS